MASRLRPPWSPKAKCQALVASAGLVIQLCWNVAPLSHPRWVESRSRGKLGVPQPVPQRDPFPPEAVFPRSLRVGGIQAPPSEEDDVSKQKRLRPQRRQPMQAEWARLMRLSKDLGCSSQPPQGPIACGVGVEGDPLASADLGCRCCRKAGSMRRWLPSWLWQL